MVVIPIQRIAEEARRRFASFVRGRVNPGAAERDAQGVECPRELMREAREVGLFSYALPVELGGGGADALHWGVVLEELGYLCEDGSFPNLLSLRVGLANAIFATCRQDLIDRYVRPMARAELFGSFAYSDGADPFAFRSRMRREGKELVVEGEKLMVTGAAGADVFLTFLRDEQSADLVVVLLERSDPGVLVRPLESVGQRSSGLATLKMERVRVPEERLITDADGVSQAQRMLNARRLFLVASQVGAMRGLHELCVLRLRETVRYGVPLTEMQNVQAALGRQYVAVESARAMLHRALTKLAGYEGRYDPLFDPLLSAAKHHITERGLELATSAMRLLGGRGYLSGWVERFFRDSCGLLAGGGTQDVLEIDLGLRSISEVERRAGQSNGATSGELSDGAAHRGEASIATGAVTTLGPKALLAVSAATE